MSKKTVVVIDRDWERPHGHKSNFWLLVVLAALAILMAGAAYALYWYYSDAKPLSGDAENLAELRQQVGFLQKENERLKLDLAKAERSVAIDKEAGGLLQETILQREEEIKKLEEELTFYKSIVDPENQQKGLSIRQFALEATGTERQYKFRLVAAQSGGKRSVSGKVVIRIQGRQEDAITTLSWREISAGKGGEPKFRFQYFEKLDGVFQLPEDFKPEHILVKLNPQSSKLEASQQSFSWEAALTGTK